MGRLKQEQTLYVMMNGILVGQLIRQASGLLTFIYDSHWLASELSRPISLSMPLIEQPYTGRLVENYFDNLLPDSRDIRARIQARFNTPSDKCFDLLSQIGKDCVGALQLLTKPDISNVKMITAKPINELAIAGLLKQYHTAPLGMRPNSEFRISIAGAQEKTALLWYRNKWYLPEGTTPTSHIIKLPIGIIKHANIDLTESVENEWLCLKILSAFGLSVNDAEIIKFGDTKTLVVERFDRKWSADKKWLIRLPQEDFCQAVGASPGNKYENEGGPGINAIMNMLSGSSNAVNDRAHFMKTVFLYWILGAIDGHAKNFSLAIEANGRYHLTPIYDVISAYPLAEQRQIEWQDLKMAMAVRGKRPHYKWNEIQLRHWLDAAKQCHFPESSMQEIMDSTLESMDAVIHDVSKQLPPNFPAKISTAIFKGMKKIHSRLTES